jgi:hypothetical protein
MKQMSADYRGKNHRKKNLKHGLLKHGAHTNRTDDGSWRQNQRVEKGEIRHLRSRSQFELTAPRGGN